MTQKYEPVEWTDETPTQPGTLINKARMDQMQSAHHYADGFEEVDAIPTEDPGTDYHKVVYCTADTTFYRWDGAQWTADIDDDTKRLLLEHEADHANPHQVTKAQVGLGNADNTSDADKPVSTATAAALAGKVDKLGSSPAGSYTKVTVNAQGQVTAGSNPATLAEAGITDAYTKSEINTKLADGSVTKVGTANVGSDTLPIKLVAGVPTPVTNTLIDDSTAQTITTTKIYSRDASTTSSGTNPEGSVEKLRNITVNSTAANRWFFLGGAARDSTDTLLAGIKMRYNANGNVHFALATTGSDGNPTTVELAQYDRTTDTWGSAMVSDIVSDALDAYTPMVRTTGAQTIAGSKTIMADSNNIFLLKGETALGAELNIGSAATGSDPLGQIAFVKLPTLATVATIESDAAGLLTLSGSTAVTVHSQRAYNTSNTEDVVTIGTLKASTDVVHTSGPETIQGVKTLYADNFCEFNIKSGRIGGNIGGVYFRDGNGTLKGQIYGNCDGHITMESLGTEKYVKIDNARAYDPANTTDVATIATLDAYTPMVRTTGNQIVQGTKTFSNGIIAPYTENIWCGYPPSDTWRKIASIPYNSDIYIKFEIFNTLAAYATGVLVGHATAAMDVARISGNISGSIALAYENQTYSIYLKASTRNYMVKLYSCNRFRVGYEITLYPDSADYNVQTLPGVNAEVSLS